MGCVRSYFPIINEESILQNAFDICKSDFNILRTVGFPQPVISARSRIMCLLSLLKADLNIRTLLVFLSRGLPICSTASFPSRNLIIIIIISIFKEDNVFSITDGFPYGPQVNTAIDYYRTFSDFFGLV